MNTLLIGFDLAEKTVVIVGGGELALRKARLVLKTTAHLTVIAPVTCSEIETLACDQQLTLVDRQFRPSDLDGASLVFATTHDENVDAAIALEARERHIPVNVPDRPDISSFNIPALIDRDPILVGISTDGTAPVLARQIRRQVEAILPTNLGRLARFAAGFRQSVSAVIPDTTKRRHFWEDLCSSMISQKVLSGNTTAAARDMLALLNNQSPRQGGIVQIVGAGPGDPDLLTLQALKALQDADVIIYDRLVGPEILDRARRDAERIYAGKRASDHGMGQDAINALLVERAQLGQRVVRLKGGDPFVFGRGGEEQEYLRLHKIDVQVIPGITAAIGCAAAAGIPLTHRGAASAVTFATGHGKDGLPDVDWRQFAKGDQTLAVYMGVTTADDISHHLISRGLPSETPVAVIENGTRANQRVIRTALSDVARRLRTDGITGPAIVLIGAVAALDLNSSNQSHLAASAAG